MSEFFHELLHFDPHPVVARGLARLTYLSGLPISFFIDSNNDLTLLSSGLSFLH